MTENVQIYREFLKGDLWARWDELETDQEKKISPLFMYQDHVEKLKTGLYRYLPLEHKLCLLSSACAGCTSSTRFTRLNSSSGPS